MGEKMSNAPVYFTLAQVQFNPILSVEKYLPGVQERMREAHFPDFKQHITQQFNITNEGGQFTNQPTITQIRYSFADMRGESGFILDNNALSYQTTAYDTFETFSKRFLDGLATIHEALKLDFIERIGLRYLDAVIPNSGESMAKYLVPGVLGLSQQLDGRVHTFSETYTITPAGQTASRVLIRDGQVGLPVELGAMETKINPKFTQPTGHHAIIDIDAFYQKREEFNLNNFHDRLAALHDEIDKSFKVTVTQHARSVWK